VLRGADIDLETSYDAIVGLRDSYARDLEAKEISDSVIAGVATAVRSLRGALDKTANAVQKAYGGRARVTYFPITVEPDRFEALLETNIPGLRTNHAPIADAFERHQPYHPASSELRHLPALYRVNQHHDYTLQERQELFFDQISIGDLRISIRPGEIIFGGLPSTAIPLDTKAWRAEPHHDVGFATGKTLDWHFVDPPVPVMDTLTRLHDACVAACDDISAIAKL
jgi:hypothetical protein